MDLYNTDTDALEGERVVSDIQLRDDSVIFVTVIPDPDPCAYGGNGWYMEVSANGGKSPDSPTIDVNKDGVINESDFVLIDGVKYYPGGEQKNTSDHLLSAPVCISLGDGTETCYSNTSNATVEEIDRDSGVWYGRWMWREL